jgi:hypothetical protein
MIELRNNAMVFSFPEVHPLAKLTIEFQRTLRIPDDGKSYPLPPGLGRFPLQHVDDYHKTIPQLWLKHGGVMLPMYQSEAMWLNFNSKYIEDNGTRYPFAIKVATGKINALTGNKWSEWLQQNPQDYMAAPKQPWLDGYCIEKGLIRQFVAMPLGSGYSVEEQLTDEALYGGIQIIVFPMKRKPFEKRFPKRDVMPLFQLESSEPLKKIMKSAIPDMGLAPGGRMRQEIYEDPFDLDDWEMDHKSRCFVHIANSMVWRAITGESPPTVPFTAKEYTSYDLPWFDYYSDNSIPLEGSERLKDLKSVVEMGKKKEDNPLPENENVTPENIVELRKGLKEGQVREGRF